MQFQEHSELTRDEVAQQMRAAVADMAEALHEVSAVQVPI